MIDADVTVPAPDYVQNHAAAILRGDVPIGTPPPTVRYYTNIALRCSNRLCPQPDFTASFPEVQRLLPCPACGGEVVIPEHYRGMP